MSATARKPAVKHEGALPRSMLRRAVSTARTVRTVVASPPFVTPGHFYSPLTSEADRDRARTWTDAPGVDLAAERQLTLADRLLPVLAEPMPGPRYVPANGMFGPGDAAVYRAMLAEFPPARVLEVGSGYSTAVALDEADSNPVLSRLEITCIEPYPDRLLGLLKDADHGRVSLLRQPVQDVGLEPYEQLGPGDVLFIDSTHVAKAGSDVVWLVPAGAAQADRRGGGPRPRYLLAIRVPGALAAPGPRLDGGPPAARLPGRQHQLGDLVLLLLVLAAQA
jgi:hypothetical protein